MKLAFVVSGKSPTSMPGGLGSYSYNAAKSLFDLGYRVFIVGVSGEDAVIEETFCTFIHVRSPWRKLASVSAFRMMHSLARRISELIDENPAQEIVILGAGIWGKVGLDVKKARRDSESIRTLASYFTTFRHEYQGQKIGAPASDYGVLRASSISLLCKIIEWFYVPVEHRMLRRIDRIIVHYDSSKQILLSEIEGLGENSIRKIPYYIELYDRAGNALVTGKNEKTRIVCICRQDPRKGLNTLLHALKLLKDGGVVFDCVLAGSGPFRKPNEQLARKLGLEKDVSLPGFVASAEQLLDETDIFVLPSVEEGSGAISLLEAMHKGLPIVTTNCDGIPEDFIDGETGFLVDMCDAQTMADRLNKLIHDPLLRQRLGENVKRRYEEKFRLEYMVEGFRAILAEF